MGRGGREAGREEALGPGDALKVVGTFACGFVSPGRCPPPLRPSAVICSPFAEEIAPCAASAAAAPAAPDHTEREGQRDLDIPYPS